MIFSERWDYDMTLRELLRLIERVTELEDALYKEHPNVFGNQEMSDRACMLKDTLDNLLDTKIGEL
jgi:hypothetical protein